MADEAALGLAVLPRRIADQSLILIRLRRARSGRRLRLHPIERLLAGDHAELAVVREPGKRKSSGKRELVYLAHGYCVINGGPSGRFFDHQQFTVGAESIQDANRFVSRL